MGPWPGVCISTTPLTTATERLAAPKTLQSAKPFRRLQLRLQRQGVRRRAIRAGLLSSNLIILAAIIFFVIENHTSNLAQPALNSSPTVTATANPLDQVSSDEIAQTVAQLNALPESVAIANQAESQSADLVIASADSNDVISKPQVLATSLKSRADIQPYTAVAGDTISSLASRFGVTSNSIRWSNNLGTGEAVAAGTKLLIPPVNGLVYTVKAGDTPASLAAKYGADASQIIAYNDAELNGLQPGEQIIIPNGVQAVPAVVAAATTAFPWGGGPIYGFNGYDFGYCTWYVATQIAVPSNWGNADTWAHYAALSGWHVSMTPTVGAIAQTDAGFEGHVAVVIGVSPDGSQIEYRDMNNYGDGGGWDRVGQAWGSTSTFEHYITR